LIFSFAWFTSSAQHIARLRSEDNFDYLLTDTLQKSWDEKIKFMPLFSGVKVSVGGEWREQYQNYKQANFGQMPASYTEESPHQWLHRWLLHADLRVNARFRIFTQLNNTVRFWNPNPILSQVEQNLLSVHQFFGEYKWNQKFHLRVGKQEMQLGQERFIASREGPNNRQTFLGAQASYTDNKAKVMLFYLNPVKMNLGAFDDGLMDEQIGGMYVAKEVLPKRLNLDAFYFNFRSTQRSYVFKSGLEQRHTGGIRLYAPLKTFNYELELAYQWGTFKELAIRSWMLVWDTNYQLKPYLFLGMGGNYVPGDKSSTDSELNTFNTLFARPPFGQTVALNITNTLNISPYLRFQKGTRWLVTARASFVNRISEEDGIYTPNMSALRPIENGAASLKKELCSIYALDFNYNTTSHLFSQFEIGYCQAGDYLKESGSGKNVVYFALRNAYRF
jgi:hypothetical protein